MSQLAKFKRALIAHREELKVTPYKLCIGWELGSWGSYVELEKKGNPTLKTLLKLSDKLGMEFIIKDGKIEIK